jgi:hypothetical protein
MEESLSEYEQLRARNIRRNEDVMSALGLFDSDVANHRTRHTKRDRAEPTEPTEPTRRSTRLRGERAPGADEQRQEAAAEALNDAHAAEGASHPRPAGRRGLETRLGPTSYAHALRRYRDMTETALRGRTNRIENAAGGSAIVKLRMFARVCYLEEAFDLAAGATAALKRLIVKLGDDGGDDEDDESDEDDVEEEEEEEEEANDDDDDDDDEGDDDDDDDDGPSPASRIAKIARLPSRFPRKAKGA